MDEGSVFNQRMFSVEGSSVISGGKQSFQWRGGREVVFSVEGSVGKQCFQWREMQRSSVFSGWKQCCCFLVE